MADWIPDVHQFLFLVLIIFGILILPLVLLFFVAIIIEKLLPQKKCALCAKEARDVLSDSSNHRIGVFCRNHLMQEYSKRFLTSPFRKVMVEPQPTAAGYLGPVYGYFPVSEIKQFGWQERAKKVLEELLATINGKSCRECKESATTLFLSKEVAPWSKYGSEPRIEYAKVGDYLCNRHALKRLTPGIQTNPKYYDDAGGLWLPYKEGGFQVSTEL